MYRANDRELRQLLSIIEKLGRSTDSRPLRQSIAEDLLQLIQADMLASFVWNDHLHQFEDVACRSELTHLITSTIAEIQVGHGPSLDRTQRIA